MRILIISDAAEPQVNGVVTTLRATKQALIDMGHDVRFITPQDFRSFRLPGYSEIMVPISTKGLEGMMDEFNPDCIHISTEGRLGWAARRICGRRGWKFTTAYHTDFPRFLSHFGIPKALTFAILRAFHSRSCGVMVSTDTITEELRARGFRNLVRWGRGVDPKVFHPREVSSGWQRPIFLNVGRVSAEKNLRTFMDLDLPGTTVIVGDGPMMHDYLARYPDVVFVGAQHGDDLAELYSMADVFVFPSRADTFGLVMIEAMACGTPVAAYPVQGPVDVVVPGAGILDDDLRHACMEALTLDPKRVAEIGRTFTWENATRQFISGLVLR